MLHGVDPTQLELVGQSGGIYAPEAMILNDKGEVCWINAAKSRRLGDSRALEVLGHRCLHSPELCLGTCKGHCAALEPWHSGGAAMGSCVFPSLITSNTTSVITEILPLNLPNGQRRTLVRHSSCETRPMRHPSAQEEGRKQIWTAMAALTTGLAHELRNPLAAMEMRLTAMLRRPSYDLNERSINSLNDLRGMVDRIGRVVDSLCGFDPGGTLSSDDFELVPIINDVLMEHMDLLDGIEVIIDTCCEGKLHADPLRVRQAVSALVVNSGEAMNGEGTLTITLTEKGGWCLIDVEDTGPGIPAEIQGRLGQPFVTTKPPGHGAGLGLSLCYLNLDRHGGRMSLIRTGPEGTVMRISLPGFESRGGNGK